MDIMGALTTISQAIKTVKDLKEIEHSLDTASFKAKMAEIYSNLADIKIALADAKEIISEKNQMIKSLEGTIQTLKSGEKCPICQSGKLKIIESKPDPIFGVVGMLQQILKCQNVECNHTEPRQYKPNGITGA